MFVGLIEEGCNSKSGTQNGECDSTRDVKQSIIGVQERQSLIDSD